MKKEDIPNRSGIYFFFMPKLNVGYIGRTNDLQRRFYEHTVEGSHRREIKRYIDLNNDFEFLILEFTDGFKVKDQALVEKEWMVYYKKKGMRLLNVTDPTMEVQQDPKAVLQFDLKGNFIAKYHSTWDAGKQFKTKSKISECALGKIPTYKKHIWLYESPETTQILKTRLEDYFLAKKAKSERVRSLGFQHQSNLDLGRKNRNKPILQYTLKGDFVKEWNSQTEASKALNITQTNIGQALLGKLKKSHGFIWKYKETLTNE